MDLSHPINPNDPGLGPMTKALTWLFTSLAIIVIITRMYVRKKFNRKWTVDDWVMVAALFFQVVFSALVTKACSEGLGMTFANMRAKQLMGALQWSWIALPFAHVVSVLARISITILLNKIFGARKFFFKWFIIIFTSLQAIFAFMTIVLNIVDQIPIKTHWDLSVKPTHQINPVVQQNIAETLLFLYAVSDLAYVIFPVMFVWELHMPLRRKLALIALLGLTAITFAAAISKAIVIALALSGHFVMKGPNFQGLFYYISTIEQCLVMIIGCVPTMRPITKLQFPTFSAIGGSIVSLISRRSRSRKGSSTGGSSLNDEVELGTNKRVSNEDSSIAKTGEGRVHNFQGKSSYSLRQDEQICRTDEYEVTYGKK